MSDNKHPTKVVTGKVRGSYVNVFRPRKDDDGNDKYSMAILVPKSDTKTVKALEAARLAAIEKKWQGKPPKGLHNTMRDGDNPEETEDPAYKGHYFINASSKDKPGIVDQARNEVTDPSRFVSGDYCRVSINAYGYEKKGNKGVAFGLNNIQILARGEPLTSRARAEDEFDEVDPAEFEDEGEEVTL